MGNMVRKGKLITSHTVTAVHPSLAGVFNVSDAEGIHEGATFSLNGTSNPGSNLYVYVKKKRATHGGTIYDIGLNWGISVSVNDTVYFSWREHGIQVAKKNVDVTKGLTRNLLFDSRVRRRGVIYATGTGINSHNPTNYKGTKETLSYVPLVLTAEDKGGAAYNYAINVNDADAVNEVSQFQTTTTNIIPSDFFALGAFYSGSGATSRAHIAGRAKSGASCTNFSFKTLRIPCGYGHMTAANFDNPTTSNTTGGHVTIDNIGLVDHSNPVSSYKHLGNKRVIMGLTSGGTTTIKVTVVNSGGNKYAINGVVTGALNLTEGTTYRFDQSDSSNSNHPFRFGTSVNSNNYTTGVTYNGNPGNAGSYTQIVVAANAPTLYYYCAYHSGMGSTSTSNISTVPAKRGLYASREGTDITTCNNDDYIFGTDSGVITESFRGDVQNLAVNYGSVVNSSAVPITRAVTNISSSSNVTLSVFNPYSLASTASLTYGTTGATASSIGISSSVSAGVYTYTFSTSSSSTLTFTPNFTVLGNSISIL